MNAIVSGDHLGAPLLYGPARDSLAFMESWLSERALDRAWGVLEPAPLFGVPGFRFVTHDVPGVARPALSRSRLDDKHPNCPKDEKGKPLRYLAPRGSGVVIYSPKPDSFTRFAAATEKHLAEGEGKTLALIGAGLPALGFSGIEMWHRRGEATLHPELAPHVRPGDVVHIWVDGDHRTNRNVHRGAFRLMEAIRAVGAKPILRDLPDIQGIGKVGIDDLIKQWRDRETDILHNLAMVPRLEEIPNPFTVDLKKPLDTAENFLALRYAHDEHSRLTHWQGDFYKWTGAYWERQVDEGQLRAELYDFMRRNGVNPKHTHVNSLLDALRAAAQINAKETPAWLSD